MTVTIKLEGFAELDRALADLKPATGKAVLRRVLKRRAQPVADHAARLAPRDDGDLRESVTVGTRLSKRQAGLHRRMFRDQRASVEMFVGAGALPQAHLSEFGTYLMAAQPFMRPAWDQNKDAMLAGLRADLWSEIQKTLARAEAKAARMAARSGS